MPDAPLPGCENTGAPGRALLQSALDGLGCHVAVLDRGGRIRVVNRAWRAFARESGLALPDAGVGASYLGVCDRAAAEGVPGAARVAEGIREVIRGRAEAFEIEYPCHDPADPDRRRWFFMRVAPLRGNATAAAVIEHTDVTALRRAEGARARLEGQLRDAQRLESLGALAGGIAHDFNNLLTVILGNGRLVLEELAPDSPLRSRLERVRGAAEQAARLTEQMLVYAGEGPLAKQPVELSRVVEEMRPLLDACIGGRAVLETRLDSALPTVEADPAQLRQVVLNLVINAAEALEGHAGSIGVRTGTLRAGRDELAGSLGTPDLPAGDYVFVEVSDSGAGIAPARRERLFEPFFSTRSNGRGLGLAVVLGIVRAHQGGLQVDSTPGVGTAFRVLLPRGSAAVGDGFTRKRNRAALRPVGEARILVVDDEPAVLEVAEVFLERAGFRVLCAPGGAKAVEILRSRRDEVDAVVLDLTMPEMNGVETFAALRGIRPDLPILVVSGYSEALAEQHFPCAALSGLLRKPYEPEELVERLRGMLAEAS